MRLEKVGRVQGNVAEPSLDSPAEFFLSEVSDSETLPVGIEAQELVSSVVCTLLARLDLEEAREVLDALPPDVQGMIGTCPIHQGSLGEAFNKHEFLTRVGQHLQLSPAAVEPAARVILNALRSRLPTRVASLLEGQLPHDLLALWHAGERLEKRDDAATPAALRSNPISASGGGTAMGGQHLNGFQLDVRARGFDLTPTIRQYAEDHVVGKLAKHASHLQAIIIRLEDVNGTKGGVDKCCRVEVVIPGENPLVVEEIAGDLRAAMDLVADRMEVVLQRHLEHKRVNH